MVKRGVAATLMLGCIGMLSALFKAGLCAVQLVKNAVRYNI